MKAVQAVARYFPDHCGGIQIHLNELLPELAAQGVASQIAASQDTLPEAAYTHNGIEVFRYPVFPRTKSEPNHGETPHGGFEYFANWLTKQKADIYHQHQWNPKCGLPHLRLAKQLGMSTVVTVHLAQPICQRHTLMLNGQTACDGRIEPERCSRCCGVSNYLPASAIDQLTRMPMPISVLAGGLLRRLEHRPAMQTIGSFLRPFCIPAYVAGRLRGLQEMARYADQIIAVCEWLYQALLINGIPKEKLTLCRCGVPNAFQGTHQQHVQGDQPLKVAFLGRWDERKGIHILVEAVKALPSQIPIQLVIHGIPQNEQYRQKVLADVATDPRIRVAEQLSRQNLPSALADFDLVAVPSQLFETGPLTILEAHALGIPVLGSDLGGISELVRHGINGWLVPPDDIQAWTEALARLAADGHLLRQLQQGIQPVRTLKVEAAETAALYHHLLQDKLVRI